MTNWGCFSPLSLRARQMQCKFYSTFLNDRWCNRALTMFKFPLSALLFRSYECFILIAWLIRLPFLSESLLKSISMTQSAIELLRLIDWLIGLILTLFVFIRCCFLECLLSDDVVNQTYSSPLYCRSRWRAKAPNPLKGPICTCRDSRNDGATPNWSICSRTLAKSSQRASSWTRPPVNFEWNELKNPWPNNNGVIIRKKVANSSSFWHTSSFLVGKWSSTENYLYYPLLLSHFSPALVKTDRAVQIQYTNQVQIDWPSIKQSTYESPRSIDWLILP